MPMPALDKQDYKQLLVDMPEYLQIWRSNVKDGAMYTYNLKNTEMQIYFTYSKDEGKTILSLVRQLYRDGHLVAIAILHLTDKDIDGQPDSALYTSYFFGPKSIQTSFNTPSDVPSANDINAWNTWMALLIQQFNRTVEEMNQPENVDPE